MFKPKHVHSKIFVVLDKLGFYQDSYAQEKTKHWGHYSEDHYYNDKKFMR